MVESEKELRLAQYRFRQNVRLGIFLLGFAVLVVSGYLTVRLKATVYVIFGTLVFLSIFVGVVRAASKDSPQ